MASFDLLVFGRGKTAGSSSLSHQDLTKIRLRAVQQVYKNRRLISRNRIESCRCNLVLSTIENAHKREQATQRIQRQNVLNDLKRKKLVADSCLTLLPSYAPIDITEPKDFYRFGVRVQSAGPHARSRAPAIRSDPVRSNGDSAKSRAKSGSNLSRPYTAPLQTYYHDDLESDDETVPFSISRTTSGKSSTVRSTSAVSSSIRSHTSSDLTTNNIGITPSRVSSSSHRITWPIQIKVFALQDEDEARQQYLAWRNEQRKTKIRRSSKQFFDYELERKYQESIRRRKEIEAFVTPDLIKEHRINDPVFAKRYHQLKLAVRAGKIPTYDPADREIKTTVTKSKMERARTALITAKQSKIKNFYSNQQIINDANLSKRIDTFIKRLTKLKEEQE